MRATLESSSKRGSFDKIFSRQEFWNFENWKWEIENIFCIVCELKESENHHSKGCPKKITFKLIFEFLGLEGVFLGVKNNSKNVGNKKNIRLLIKILSKWDIDDQKKAEIVLFLEVYGHIEN